MLRTSPSRKRPSPRCRSTPRPASREPPRDGGDSPEPMLRAATGSEPRVVAETTAAFHVAHVHEVPGVAAARTRVVDPPSCCAEQRGDTGVRVCSGIPVRDVWSAAPPRAAASAPIGQQVLAVPGCCLHMAGERCRLVTRSLEGRVAGRSRGRSGVFQVGHRPGGGRAGRGRQVAPSRRPPSTTRTRPADPASAAARSTTAVPRSCCA